MSGGKTRWMRSFSCWLLVTCLILTPVVCGAVSAEESFSPHISATGHDLHAMTLDAMPQDLLNMINDRAESATVSIADDQADDVNSITLERKDGSRSVLTFAEPVKYLDEETNQIRFINHSLQPTSALKGWLTGTAYVNQSDVVSLSFPHNLQNGITLTHDQQVLKMIPLGKSVASPILKSVDALGLERDTLEYADVFGLGTSLQYTSIPSGVKEAIVIQQQPEKNFSFEIQAQGMIVEQSKNGSISCVDEVTGEVIYVFHAPWAVDSYDGEEDGFDHLSNRLIYEVEGGDSPYCYRVNLCVDKEWLSDPRIVYPVVIDPTVTHGYQDGNMPYTTVFSAESSTWPSSSYEYMQVGYRSGYGYSIGYLQMTDMSPYLGINPEMITSATLNLRQTYGNSKTYSVSMYDSNTSVSRDNATYAILSANLGTKLSSRTCSSNATYHWSITPVFRTWLGYELAGNGWSSYQVMLKATTDSTANTYKQFFCSYSNLYLQVDYNTFLDGLFAIKNYHSGKYLDASSNTAGSGAGVVQNTFTGDVNQLWEIHYQGNGWYVLYSKIGNRFSLGLTSYAGGAQVTTGNSSSAYQKFKLQRLNSSGTYKMISYSTGWGLEVKNSSTSNGAIVQPATYTGESRQKWILERIDETTIWDDVPQIGQNTNSWCWVASAKMIASFIAPNSSYINNTQEQAVRYVKNDYTGNVYGALGSSDESRQAVRYFTSNSSLSFTYNDSGVLSSSELVSVIANGHPVYCKRSEISLGEVVSNHATVIYGYYKYNNTYWFLMRNPWPPTGIPNTQIDNEASSNCALTYSTLCHQIVDADAGYEREWISYYYVS